MNMFEAKQLYESRYSENYMFFIDGLCSEADDIYEKNKKDIYLSRRDQMECELGHIVSYVGNGHRKQSGLGYNFMSINKYLSVYFKRDNLVKLCMEFIFVQEYAICYPYTKDKRDILVDKIVSAILDRTIIEFDDDVEMGLYGYMKYVLSDSHLYEVVIDYLIHCREMGGINIFREDIKKEIIDVIRKSKEYHNIEIEGA